MLHAIAYQQGGPLSPAASADKLPIVSLSRAPGYLIRPSQRAHGTIWARRAGTELTGPQYAVLVALASEPGADQVTVGPLSSGPLVHADIVARLMRSGWVRHERRPRYGRRSILSLTPEAARHLDEERRLRIRGSGADQVILVLPGGDVLHGSGHRHMKYPIHTETMAHRDDVGAVVHTHSDAGNAFCALDVPLRPLNHAGCLFSYPEIPRFTLTGGLIRDPELGRALAGTLASASACLMPQYDLVTAGPDLPAAVMTAVLLDRACRTQLTAMAAGPLAIWGSEEDIVAKRVIWDPPAAGRLGLPAPDLCRARQRRGLSLLGLVASPGELPAITAAKAMAERDGRPPRRGRTGR